MKRFLIKFAIFLVITYSLSWVVDYIVSTGQTYISGYPQQTWREIRSETLDCDGVIMGTSRGLEHFDPLIIDSITGHSFYNLGMGGYPINVELMKYRCYCNHNPKPQYIIQEADYITMAIGMAVHEHQSEQYLPLIYDKPMRQELLQVGYTPLDVYFPLYRYWGYQTHIKRGVLDFFHISHHTEFISYKGHTPDPGQWSMNNLKFTDSVSAKIKPDAKGIFEAYLQQCKKRNIHVVLVNSPKYYGLTKVTTDRDEEISYFDSISEVYDIPYLDYVSNYWMCNDSSFFNAGVHLTPQGTKVFSKEFANDLVALGFFE